jgi:aspartyl-tRNA(Asn)/glutamyl-tRNA(Gln) amidotransferase subunit B
MTDYKVFIGMEVHVELATEQKMFCGCSATHFQVEPNTHTCPVCLGLPGALPVPNKEAIQNAVKIGLALGCQTNYVSKFDRKHYFYPDLPKSYQISQYDLPFSYDGKLKLSDGKVVGIRRVHLEEDTGKLQHRTIDGKEVSLVDFNRSSVPLVEIVTEPDINSADEAKEYLRMIHSLVRYLGVSDADMEKGSMRLEANISISPDGNLPSYKVEVKNVNSFRFIAAAIDYEIERHKKIIESGELPAQETMGYDSDLKRTVAQRSKEEAKDYRYFPEPDIPRILLDKDEVETWKKSLPMLPYQVVEKLMLLGVRREYAVNISEDQKFASYCMELAEISSTKGLDVDKTVGLVMNNKEDWNIITPQELVEKVKAESQKVMMSEDQIRDIVKTVITSMPKVAEDYKAGKTNAINSLLGQVMGRSKGQASAMVVKKILEEELK